MSLSPYKTWIAGEVLTAADLNASFSNILNNAATLISPLTGPLDLNGNALVLDEDGDFQLVSSEDDVLDIQFGGIDVFSFIGAGTLGVNGIFFETGETGDPALLYSQSSTDTNVDLFLSAQGSGVVGFDSGVDFDGNVLTLDADGDTNLSNPSDDVIALRRSGTQIFKWDLAAASPVNGYTSLGTATAGTPSITAQGSDSNISLNVAGKGTGYALADGTEILSLLENDIVNPQFRFWQRSGTTVTSTGSANNDDRYICDRWILLADGNDIVDCSREATVVPTNSTYAIKLDVETQDKKFGIFQPLELARTIKYRGSTASLTFKARITNSSISAIRVGVVQWTSTADTITSDIVSAWNAAGSNPTLVANWAFANTPAALTALTTSYQTYTIDNVAISASANNIGLFIWTDDTTLTVGDFLYIAEVGLYRSAKAPTWAYRDERDDFANCMRFFEKSITADTASGDGVASDFTGAIHVNATTAQQPIYWWKYSVPKRVTATVAMYNPRAGGAAGQWTNSSADLAAARAIQGNEFGVSIDNTGTVASTTGQWLINVTADAEL